MALLKYEEQLQKLFANTNDWLKFAEAKNLGLLTLNAAFAFGFTQIQFHDGNPIQIAGSYVFTPFALLSFLVALLSLFPILTKILKGDNLKSWINKFSNWIDKEQSFENIHFYGYLKDLDESEFEQKFLEKTGYTDPFLPYEKELGTQILFNSRIAWMKFQLFKIGAFLFSTGIILGALSLPIILFLK